MDIDFEAIFEDDDEEFIVFLENQRSYTVRDRTDHLSKWDDKEFFNRFRLSKPTVNRILQEILPLLQHREARYHAIPPVQQLLLTLRFYATGCIYITVGDFGGIHKTTAGRIIKKVTESICSLRNNDISMPADEEGCRTLMQGLYKLARFPRVIGALDCTHIKIQSPGGQQPELFRNRKGYFSVNVQAVCNSENRFMNIVARWPGSVHDSHIFNSSNIRRDFDEHAFGNAVLLGDSGYALRTYLMTPLQNPHGNAENLYNESHIRTRQVIERTFGIWKRRFAILSIGMRCRIPLVQQIILATAILHNIAIDAREEEFPDDQALNDYEEQEAQLQNEHHLGADNARQDFINYFSTL